jgi:predicted lipoprotein with Yx(FWY)xxD motif
MKSMSIPVPTATRLAATLLCAAPLAAACSSTASPGSTSPGPGTAGTVVTTKAGPDGTYLADGTGRALYLWVKDPAGKSVCTGACTGAWPPLKASGAVTATGGARSSALSSLTRPDGTKQVAYDGHPLYYFAGDSGPGQTSGQGSDGFGAKWWLVAPSGASVTGQSPAPAPSSSSSSSSGGYGGGY